MYLVWQDENGTQHDQHAPRQHRHGQCFAEKERPPEDPQQLQELEGVLTEKLRRGRRAGAKRMNPARGAVLGDAALGAAVFIFEKLQPSAQVLCGAHAALSSLSALLATLNGTQVFRLSDFAARATSADHPRQTSFRDIDIPVHAKKAPKPGQFRGRARARATLEAGLLGSALAAAEPQAGQCDTQQCKRSRLRYLL